MVRLREPIKKRIPIKAKFQFQCGTIESVIFQLSTESPSVFQFQCGTIESYGPYGFQKGAILFQFQCGTIERRVCLPVFVCVEVISIPVWYD